MCLFRKAWHDKIALISTKTGWECAPLQKQCVLWTFYTCWCRITCTHIYLIIIICQLKVAVNFYENCLNFHENRMRMCPYCGINACIKSFHTLVYTCWRRHIFICKVTFNHDGVKFQSMVMVNSLDVPFFRKSWHDMSVSIYAKRFTFLVVWYVLCFMY